MLPVVDSFSLFCKNHIVIYIQSLTMQIEKKQARTTSKYAIAKYTQVFCTSDLSNITASQRTKTIFFFLIVPVPVYPPQYYWPLLHVSRFLYSLNKTSQARQNWFFQTYVKFLRVLQNPTRFALSRDAVSGVFYWFTSYRCQSWLHMRNIVLQPL